MHICVDFETFFGRKCFVTFIALVKMFLFIFNFFTILMLSCCCCWCWWWLTNLGLILTFFLSYFILNCLFRKFYRQENEKFGSLYLPKNVSVGSNDSSGLDLFFVAEIIVQCWHTSCLLLLNAWKQNAHFYSPNYHTISISIWLNCRRLRSPFSQL